jgi:hypothetical protein
LASKIPAHLNDSSTLQKFQARVNAGELAFESPAGAGRELDLVFSAGLFGVHLESELDQLID